MSARVVFLDGAENIISTPADADALAALLHGIYMIRKRLGSTAFDTAAASATTARDATGEGTAIGTVTLLTSFGAQA